MMMIMTLWLERIAHLFEGQTLPAWRVTEAIYDEWRLWEEYCMCGVIR
jgi:hypothetical protein